MITERKMNFMVMPNPWDFGWAIQIGIDERDKGKGWAVADPVVFRDRDIGEDIGAPCLTFTTKEMQNFMDEMWRAGIRPSSGEGNVGQIGATERHLNDMRKIVEKNLDIKL